jgi:hypothetical protein
MHHRGKTYLKTNIYKSICCKKSLKINYHRCNHKLKSDDRQSNGQMKKDKHYAEN